MRARILLAALALVLITLLAREGGGQKSDPSGDPMSGILGLVREAPAALPQGDRDRDGLSDDQEIALARSYAPVVILDAGDDNLPASVPWLLARQPDLTLLPSVALASALPTSAPRRPFSSVARAGSPDMRDWTTYVHVYPRADGGTNLQYWFFYPYSDGPLFFDHESDWEHLTVHLSSAGQPLGIYLSRHEDNNPGVYRKWSRIRLSGEHPVVLSASGTHAVYADQDDLAWFESAGDCADLDRCENLVWRTWQGGGLWNLGERAAPPGSSGPELAALAYPGRWGSVGALPGTSAPHGPAHQRGFCHAGYAVCREALLPGQASAVR